MARPRRTDLSLQTHGKPALVRAGVRGPAPDPALRLRRGAEAGASAGRGCPRRSATGAPRAAGRPGALPQDGRCRRRQPPGSRASQPGSAARSPPDGGAADSKPGRPTASQKGQPRPSALAVPEGPGGGPGCPDPSLAIPSQGCTRINLLTCTF